MLNILLVDNNILFREGLANLLQKEPGIRIVGEAGSISETSEKLDFLEANLALVASDLPDIDNLEGIRVLRRRCPRMQVVLVSADNSADLLIDAVRAGARGYLLKNNSLSKLLASIRALERGEAVIPRSMVGRLLDEISRMSAPQNEDGLSALTRRELDVLQELGCGRSNRQIAECLAIAENTVKVHVHNILEKLNLRNRRQAARFARSQNFES